MTQSLEDKLLSPGIHSLKVNGHVIPTSQSFIDEVRQFTQLRDGRQGTGDIAEFPFVNQDKPFVQLVRALATEYPYAILLGDAGVGKTMIIDFVSDVIQGKIPLENVEKMAPELVPEFKKIIDRASGFEHRHHLLLPNLKDPMSVSTLSYTDNKQYDKDAALAQSFCQDLGVILGNYAADHRSSIKLNLTKDEFEQYIKSKISGFYVNLYEGVANITDPVERATSTRRTKPQSHFALVTVEPPNDLYRPSTLESKWKFVERKTRRRQPSMRLDRYKTGAISGYAREARGLTNEQLEIGLGKNLIYKRAVPLISNLLWELTVLDVEGLEDEQKFEIFREAFVDYTKDVVEPMADAYQTGDIPSQQAMLSELKTQGVSYYAQRRLSEKTIDDIATRVRAVRGRYGDGMGVSDGLKSWMDSVVTYFKTERVALERTVQTMWDKIREIESKNPPEIREREKGKKENEKSEEEKQTERKSYGNVHFELRHGKYTMDIKAIMQVNTFRDTSSSEAVTINKVREFSEENLFGTFKAHDEKIPPHMAYATLGTFFKGGVLVFPDSFSDFVKTIAGGATITIGDEEINQRSMREQFLDYLQTGNLTVVKNGINYKLNVPKVLIGSDNQDPFLTIHGAFLRNEAGLRDRITSVYVPFIADNTQEARHGTLTVLYRALAEFNKRSSQGDGVAPITITDEAADMLLKSNTIALDRIVLLEYRGFSKLVEDICAYARMKKETKITPQLLKQRTLDNLPPAFFLRIDRGTTDYGGYAYRPDKQAGSVNAVAVYPALRGGLTGSYVPIQSYFVPSIDRLPPNKSRIELVDIESHMTDETAIKGFELAQDYIKRFIDSLRRGEEKVLSPEEGWQLKTEFRDMWGGIGGPSASLATTLSMLSALSGEEMYKNRFVTGTIDPSDGSAGVVSGVYYKGLVPCRVSELLGLEGSSDPMYFLLPAASLKEMTRDIIFDPFGMEKRVAILPVTSIGQAYYLMTHGPKLNERDWQQSLELGNDALKAVRGKIIENYRAAPKLTNGP
ncbi:MAG: hypothetical protein AABW61_00985 [Candidatus Aenigmatarchaeota archaeon]